jgi:hypothetical protein
MVCCLRANAGARYRPCCRCAMKAGVREADGRDRRSSVLLGFAPWIIFDVVAGPSTWEFAALGAFIAAVVLSWPDLREGRYMILDVAGIVFFGVLVVLGIFLDRSDLHWVERNAQVLSSGVLAVLALGSLAFTPFTEQYARLSVPREVWGSPVFRKINRVLTAARGIVFAVIAVLGYIGLHVGRGHDWFSWIIPIALLVWAIKFTEGYPDRVTGGDGEEPSGAAAVRS